MTVRIETLTSESYARLVGSAGSPLVHVDELRYHESIARNDTWLLRVAALAPPGDLVGYGLAASGPFDPTPPAGHFELRIRVAPAARGQGVGGRLYETLASFATAHGATALVGAVRDDDETSLAWVARRGGEVTQHVFPSTLDLTSYDPTPFAPAIEHVPKRLRQLLITLSGPIRPGQSSLVLPSDFGQCVHLAST
jgi:GNAT superfamily N-acetyltransferase